MLIVVQHQLSDPSAAFARGERLQHGDGAPDATRVLQFYPSQDGSLVTCLWESPSIADLQTYVDETLGETSVNLCYPVETAVAFAQLPEGIAERPPAVAV